MKTKLLWLLILSVGVAALYLGIVRPDVSTVPKRIQDYVAVDPATRPAVQLPPLVVSESRLPAETAAASEAAGTAATTPIRKASTSDSEKAPVLERTDRDPAVTKDARSDSRK